MRKLSAQVCEEFGAAGDAFPLNQPASRRLANISRSYSEAAEKEHRYYQDLKEKTEAFLEQCPDAALSPAQLTAQTRDRIAMFLKEAGLKNDEIAQVIDVKFETEKAAALDRIDNILTDAKQVFLKDERKTFLTVLAAKAQRG